MQFRGWRKTSLIEYPGRISSVLFTGTCNFRCPFCYNKDLVLNPGKLPAMSEAEVLAYLKNNVTLYHAVAITGGEPTIHKGLPAFLAKVKRLDLLVGLETNGTNPVMLKRLIKDKLVDFVSVDIKAPLVLEKYRKAAGIKDKRLFEKVKKSVSLLLGPAGSGIDYEFRTTVVPGIHEEQDIVEISRQIKGAKRYVLQQFLPQSTIDDKTGKSVPYTAKFLTDLRKKVKANVDECEVRNL